MSDVTSGNAREPRGQARHCGSSNSNSSSSRTVSRNGHPSRLRSISAAVETGEVTDVMQQLRAEVNDTISGRMDMLNIINTALQNVSARPAETKPNQ